MWTLIIRGMLVYVALGVGGAKVVAHHSPEDVIADLSAEIELHGDSPRRLVRRADEWRILGEPSKAIADYQSALKLKPNDLVALHGLARTLVSKERFKDAIDTAERGVALAADRDARAPFYAVAATAHVRLQDHRAALVSWKNAIDCEKPEVDWLVQHARTLQVLNRHDDACRSLAAAKKSNPSVVLHRAWIDSLIRCKKFDLAETQIEQGLQRARWKSSHLLQRAELRWAMGEFQLARRDAKAARDEIVRRTVPDAANPLLEKQRQRATQLLQKIDAETSHSEASNI